MQVYNSASVAPDILAEAEIEVTRIFRTTGITVLWLNCPLSESDAIANPVCIAPCPLNRLAIRINSEMPADLSENSLGLALTETGIYATIYYPRVEEYVKRGVANRSQIMGHAISHEMGHLLLGPSAHARFGIMRATWTHEDLHSMAMGALLFSSRESRIMRGAIIQRMRSGENSGFSASSGASLDRRW